MPGYAVKLTTKYFFFRTSTSEISNSGNSDIIIIYVPLARTKMIKILLFHINGKKSTENLFYKTIFFYKNT